MDAYWGADVAALLTHNIVDLAIREMLAKHMSALMTLSLWRPLAVQCQVLGGPQDFRNRPHRRHCVSLLSATVLR
jgi:hypothetical protein